MGERTGLMVRASDSGSEDPGSILGQVGVLFSRARDIYSPKVLVIPRNKWLGLNMTEKLFTGTLNKNQNKKLNGNSCLQVFGHVQHRQKRGSGVVLAIYFASIHL